MILFLLRRLLLSIPTLLVCALFVFIMTRLIPGDPVDHLLGERGSDPKIKQELNIKWGLDKPLYQQYFIFLFRSLKGDLGKSLISGDFVLKEFTARFPATIELSFCALLFAIILGVPFGFLSALKVNSFWDFLFSGLSLTTYSMSVFWWGLILILCFSIYLNITPVSGRIDVLYEIDSVTGFMLIDAWFSEEKWNAFQSAVKHLVLPVLTLSTIPLAYIIRITRFSLLETIKEDFIRTARSKGLSPYRIYFVHAFRNALLPIITVMGLMLGSLLAGAVLTETVFSWPGIGRWLVGAVLARDYPVLQGGILLITIVIVLLNIGIDGVYSKLDPRVIVK